MDFMELFFCELDLETTLHHTEFHIKPGLLLERDSSKALLLAEFGLVIEIFVVFLHLTTSRCNEF